MSNLEDIKFFDNAFAQSGIVNFSGKEICNGWDIPDELLKNIFSTVKILQDLRTQYGKPIYLNSTYRSPDYNKAVGGALNSMHLQFNAIDFTVKNHSDLETLYNVLDNWDRLHKYYTKKMFGLGKYKTFIHFDTRGTLGKASARWVG
jgi:hypothetical protein